MIKSRFMLRGALCGALLVCMPGLTHAQNKPEPAAGVNLSSETPADLIKGNVTLNLKVKLPEGDTNTRGLSVRITAMTISNGKMKVMEWPHEGKTNITAKVERASTVVVTAWRTGPKPLRQSEVKFWRAQIPNAKPGQTDTEPVTVDWTLDMVPEPEVKASPAGQDLAMAFKLEGKQFNTYMLWLDPATSKAELNSYKNLGEAKAAIAAKKISNAMIIRANETESDAEPVKSLTMYSAGVRSNMCPNTFTLWTTGPEDGLILVRRVSEVKDEFVSLSKAPVDAALYRKQIMFKLKDIGDFSSANKAPVLGPTFYGKLGGKYFKFRLGLLELNPTPEEIPMEIKARIVVQPDGTNELPGE